MRDTTRPIKNQDCYSKNFRSILASDARFVRRVRRGNRAEKICGRKVRPMSSRVAQRHAAGSYDSCDSRVSASGRLITLVAALILGAAAFGDQGLVYPLLIPAIGALTTALWLARNPLNRRVGRVMFTAVAILRPPNSLRISSTICSSV